MNKDQQMILTIDGIVNLGLGVLLLLVPLGTAEVLGVPRTNLDFYPTILGGVIFGIGMALLVERYGYSRNIRGLGMEGAIVINLCGATTLFIWLVFSPPDLPLRGYAILWSIVILVFGIGLAEIVTRGWHHE